MEGPITTSFFEASEAINPHILVKNQKKNFFFLFREKAGKKHYKMLNLVAFHAKKYGYIFTNFLYFPILFYKYYFHNGKKK